MPNTDLILTHLEPPLATITINRPAQRNALNAAMWQALSQAVNECANNEAVRVIIITGAGERAFVAGADIAELQSIAAQPEQVEKNIYHSLAELHEITAAPKPVIAMINGACFGGGVLLAATCDLRFASASAQFSIPAARLGVAYPYIEGILPLVNLVGPANALDLLLSGRVIEAAEAHSLGLINRVLPPGELVTATREYALLLAQGAPLTQRAHKLAVQTAAQALYAQPAAALAAALTDCYTSADYREGIAAFLAKRAPHFSGK